MKFYFSKLWPDSQTWGSTPVAYVRHLAIPALPHHQTPRFAQQLRCLLHHAAPLRHTTLPCQPATSSAPPRQCASPPRQPPPTLLLSPSRPTPRFKRPPPFPYTAACAASPRDHSTLSPASLLSPPQRLLNRLRHGLVYTLDYGDLHLSPSHLQDVTIAAEAPRRCMSTLSSLHSTTSFSHPAFPGAPQSAEAQPPAHARLRGSPIQVSAIYKTL